MDESRFYKLNPNNWRCFENERAIIVFCAITNKIIYEFATVKRAEYTLFGKKANKICMAIRRRLTGKRGFFKLRTGQMVYAAYKD